VTAIKIIPDHSNKKSLISIEKAPFRWRKGIRTALFVMGRASQLHVRSLIKSKDKTGRLYHFRGRLHQASAPGEAPASMTGKLSRSVGYTVRGYYEVEFGDEALYGKFLEDGTKNMKARGHIVRTAKELGKDHTTTLLEGVAGELKSV